MKINKNDIASIYVAFTDIPGGKNRPVLILEDGKDTITFFKITTKYTNKSPKIKKNYYPIIRWKTCGLYHQSYIDTGFAAEVKKSDLGNVVKIGELNINDIIGLNNFQKQKMKRQK